MTKRSDIPNEAMMAEISNVFRTTSNSVVDAVYSAQNLAKLLTRIGRVITNHTLGQPMAQAVKLEVTTHVTTRHSKEPAFGAYGTFKED